MHCLGCIHTGDGANGMLLDPRPWGVMPPYLWWLQVLSCGGMQEWGGLGWQGTCCLLAC